MAGAHVASVYPISDLGSVGGYPIHPDLRHKHQSVVPSRQAEGQVKAWADLSHVVFQNDITRSFDVQWIRARAFENAQLRGSL